MPIYLVKIAYILSSAFLAGCLHIQQIQGMQVQPGSIAEAVRQ